MHVCAANYFEGIEEHKGSEEIREGLNQMEPDLSSVDDEVSQVDVGLMGLSDGDVIVFIELLKELFLNKKKVNDITERWEYWEDTSPKREEVFGLLPFEIVSKVFWDHLDAGEPHYIVQQEVHEGTDLSAIEQDLSDPVLNFRSFSLSGMLNRFRKFIHKSKQSKDLSTLG